MAKVHPETFNSSCYVSSERKMFTLWMKSLVIHSNGCTVSNSSGEIVFRVDNYHTRRCNEVFLMNVSGEVLFSIKRKRLSIFGVVEGYKWTNKDFQQWFKIKGNCNFVGRGNSIYRVIHSCDEVTRNCYYNIFGFEGKSTMEIIDNKGRILAKVMPKQSLEGFSLGDDVFTLAVEPEIDQSVIMALVIAYGMINYKI